MAKMTQTDNSVKAILKRLFNAMIEQLKGAFVKKALKKILGSAVTGGFKVWLFTFILEKLYDEVAVPFFKFSAREGLFIVDKATGKIKIKKWHKAREERDEETYNDLLDDI